MCKLSKQNQTETLAVRDIFHFKFSLLVLRALDEGEGRRDIQEHPGGCAHLRPFWASGVPSDLTVLLSTVRKDPRERVSGHCKPGPPATLQAKGLQPPPWCASSQGGLARGSPKWRWAGNMNSQEMASEARRGIQSESGITAQEGENQVYRFKWN